MLARSPFMCNSFIYIYNFMTLNKGNQSKYILNSGSNTGNTLVQGSQQTYLEEWHHQTLGHTGET